MEVEAVPARQHSPTRPPPSPERHRAHSDSVKQLISQKRDVSYVQLALDLRRSQIQRLEQFAALRATTLQKAEAELDADAAHFDKFLRQNNEEVQVAVGRADQQASIRQDKVRTGLMMFVVEADQMSVRGHHGHRQVVPPNGFSGTKLPLTCYSDALRRWRSSS